MKKVVAISLSFLLALAFVPMTSQPAHAELTGNIGYVSQYVFRGALENSDGAVQGGFDYAHSSGAYAGYWTSTLGDNAYSVGAFENDFYVGYAGEAGAISYDIGALQYVYTNDVGASNDANEVYGSLGFGPASLAVTTTTKDAGSGWTTSGDIFATLSASETVAGDLGVEGLVRFSSLEDRTLGANGEDGLSQIEVGVSHPVGDSGADMSLRYIANDSENSPGGTDNQLVLGLNYGFGIAE